MATLSGAENFLPVPFKSLGFTMSRLGQDSIEERLERCFVVTNPAKGMNDNDWHGYFGGIMDMPLMETKVVVVDEVRLF